MVEIITLRAGPLLLEVYPAGGGSIVRFARQAAPGSWMELMRPALPSAIEAREPLHMSCFPLVPYCDLVAGGAFEFMGTRHILPRNHPRILDPIHGEGWISLWEVASVSPDTATLSFAHAGTSGFPFSYRSTLTFELYADRLETVITLANKGCVPMPAGIGMHPYYLRTADVIVRTSAPRVWPADAARNRSASIPSPAEWDFRHWRGFGDVDLDHSFADWSCQYEIAWPSQSIALTVTADPIFRNLLIYVPRGGDHFCMEPISNAMDAFNLASLGLEGHNVSVLQPGHCMAGRIVFAISA